MMPSGVLTFISNPPMIAPLDIVAFSQRIRETIVNNSSGVKSNVCIINLMSEREKLSGFRSLA